MPVVLNCKTWPRSIKSISGGNVFLSFFFQVLTGILKRCFPLTNGIGKKGYTSFRIMSWFEYYKFIDLNIFYVSIYCNYYPYWCTVSSLGRWSLLRWKTLEDFLFSFVITLSLIPSLLSALTRFPGLSHIFPVSDLDLAISPRSTGFFLWEVALIRLIVGFRDVTLLN